MINYYLDSVHYIRYLHFRKYDTKSSHIYNAIGFYLNCMLNIYYCRHVTKMLPRY